MQSGGVGHERVGLCPHCHSPDIRTRRQRHRQMLWRCRNCNRVFATPTIGAVSPAEWPNVDLVRPHWIQAMERGARRQGQSGGEQAQRGNFGCGCLFVVLIIVGVASFFAITRNADFPGADTLRTAGREVSQRLGGSGEGEEGDDAETAQAAPTPTPTPTRPAGTAATPQPTSRPTATTQPASTQSTRTPQPTSTPRPAVTPIQDYPSNEPLNAPAIEHWVIIFTNEERQKAGLQSLLHDPVISEIARAHSENMVQYGFSHRLQDKGPTDRALEAGYNCRADSADGRSYTYGLSENIAKRPRVQSWQGTTWFGRTSWSPTKYDADSRSAGRQLVLQWMNSSGHRENIMDPEARRIGVGVFVEITHIEGRLNETMYATQNFSSCR